MSDASLAYARTGLWPRIPLALRAILVGLLVTEAGLIPFTGLLLAMPRLTWLSVVPILLVLYWLFFSGRMFWPATMPARRENFRAIALNPVTWRWGLGAACLFVIVMEASIFTLFRLVPFPVEQFTRPAMFRDLPTTELWLTLIAASIFAGLCEETGFRGYIQRPLEQAYGPVIAIAITTVAFAALHLNQPWVITLMLPILLASVLLGVLAYATRSLIPGMIGHAVMDVCNFSYWWWSVIGHDDRRTIFEAGLDRDFLFWSAALIVSLGLFAVVVRKLLGFRKP
jgi:membrane protease YdiL (CAAX protease family)